MKLILKFDPTPKSLTVEDIKLFLNIQVANKTINMDSLQIVYQNGIAEIYIPYS
jgi:hypothetical protein